MATKKITELTTVSAVTADLYFPSDDGIQSYKASGSQIKDYVFPASAVDSLKLGSSVVSKPVNLAIAAAVATSALTVSLKTAAGTDASATDVIKIPFRNATLTTGTPVVRSVTAALSVVISSGSTLGHRSALAGWIHVYAIDNAGTVELAVSSSKFNTGTVVSTSVEGGAGAADSYSGLYSTTARSNVAITYLGRLKSTQATAGTWATAISEIAVLDHSELQGPYSLVRLSAGASVGGSSSGETRVRNFTNIVENLGSAITYAARTSTTGSKFTINEDGWYAISYSDSNTAGGPRFGLSLNSSGLSTGIDSLTNSEILTQCSCPSANQSMHQSWSGFLKNGDIIRAQTDSGSGWSSSDADCRITITKIQAY